MANELKDTELNNAAGGKAINGMYFTTLPSGWTQYRVRQGDTLSGLASKYNTTVSNLMAHNPLIDNANVIMYGYWICLPVK